MTAVEEGRGPAPGVAFEDGWVPRHLAPDRAAPTVQGPIAWQVKADARLAARELHEAMNSAPTTALEDTSQPVHQDSVAAVATDDDVPDVAGGVRWSLIATIGTMAGRMTFVIVLMRLLGPENFGIVAQATVYITIATIFLNLGLPVTLIQRKNLDRAGTGTALTLTIASALALALATVVAAPLLASFFQTQELTAVLRVISISLVLKGLAVVPTAMLARRMQFRALGMAEILSTAISGGIAVVAAVNGASYWALVIQILLLDSLYLALILGPARLPLPTWSGGAARGLWSFSSRMMGSDIINYLSNNGEKVLIARFLGATPLALYGLAGRVLVVPIETLGKTADRVILPMFSRLQDDGQRVARLLPRGERQRGALRVTPDDPRHPLRTSRCTHRVRRCVGRGGPAPAAAGGARHLLPSDRARPTRSSRPQDEPTGSSAGRCSPRSSPWRHSWSVSSGGSPAWPPASSFRGHSSIPSGS